MTRYLLTGAGPGLKFQTEGPEHIFETLVPSSSLLLGTFCSLYIGNLLS